MFKAQLSRSTQGRIAPATWLAILAGWCLYLPAPGHAGDPTVTIPVQNRNDSGVGSLRDAITFANNLAGNGTVNIEFDLPPACTYSLVLQTPLPDLVADRAIKLLGYTQSGSNPNTLENGNDATICVNLVAADDTVSHALRVPQGSESMLTVYGLSFTGFDGPAIDLEGGSAHFIYGNRFGFRSNGLVAPNVYGVRVGDAQGVRIGWDEPALRNLFGGNVLAGVLIEGSPVAAVVNNYIGTNPDGTQAIPNLTGVVAWQGASGTVIANNLISGNGSNGIVLLDAATGDTVIAGNRIGLKRIGASGSAALGNGGSGIRIDGAHDNHIGPASVGGLGSVAANAIGYNGTAGVFVQHGRGNRISLNSIRGNGGLGIDLGTPGSDPNDDDSAPQPPDSPNRELNYPVLTGASGEPQDGQVTGTLTTTPGDYVIEFFATNTCAGGDREGLGYLGSIAVTILQENPPIPMGTVDFSAAFTPLNPAGSCVIATATDTSGNTSEFSAGISYPGVGDLIFANGFD